MSTIKVFWNKISVQLKSINFVNVAELCSPVVLPGQKQLLAFICSSSQRCLPGSWLDLHHMIFQFTSKTIFVAFSAFVSSSPQNLNVSLLTSILASQPFGLMQQCPTAKPIYGLLIKWWLEKPYELTTEIIETVNPSLSPNQNFLINKQRDK